MQRELNKRYKLLIALFSIVILTSCQEGVIVDNGPACIMPDLQQFSEVDQDEQSRECVLPTPITGSEFAINHFLRDFTKEKENKMLDAIERLKLIINSEEFKIAVLEHRYKGQKTFVDNKGLSNHEVYEVLMEGAETLSPEVDQEMDIDITLYYKNNSTVGYTYRNTERIWVNDKFFAQNSLGKIAANVIHEWTHKLGFEHDFKVTDRRNYSVPYGVGTIVQKLVDEM